MLLEFYGRKPNIHETCFIASNATLIGSVSIGEYSSVWYNTVVRADLDQINIGKRTSIQDNSVLHVDEGHPMRIGDRVLVGHNTVLHGCRIGDGALIGIGAILLNGVEVGESSIVGAGSIMTENTKIPPRTLALGAPAKVKKKINSQHVNSIRRGVDIYAELAQKHKNLIFRV